jgi:uncharacterized protein
VDPDDRSSENDWFRRHEHQLLDEARREREQREKERVAQSTAAQLRELRDQHWMKCPKCGHDLKTQTLAEIDIDRCTHCEGIFLDAGEIDALVRKKESEGRGFLRSLLGM